MLLKKVRKVLETNHNNWKSKKRGGTFLFIVSTCKLQPKCSREEILGRVCHVTLELWRQLGPLKLVPASVFRILKMGGRLAGATVQKVRRDSSCGAAWARPALKDVYKIQVIWKAPVFISYCHCNKFHKLHGLKQHKFIISEFWKSKIGQQGCFFSGGSQGESVSLSFSASRKCLYSLVHGPLLYIHSQQCSAFSPP